MNNSVFDKDYVIQCIKEKRFSDIIGVNRDVVAEAITEENFMDVVDYIDNKRYVSF